MDLKATLNGLRERAKTDAAFLEELQNDPEGVLLRETGFGAHELRRYAEELSDDELAHVSGGTGGYPCSKCGADFGDPISSAFHWLGCGKKASRPVLL